MPDAFSSFTDTPSLPPAQDENYTDFIIEYRNTPDRLPDPSIPHAISVIDDFELSGLFLSTEKYPSSAEKYFDIAANALLWKEFNDFFPQGAFAADPTDWTIHIAIHLI